MLEKVTFNKKPMKKAVYKEQWDELLAKLVVLQQQAHNEGVGLVVLFEAGTAPARAVVSPISCIT